MEKSEKVVNFIGIGTVKSATTWIAKCLAEHPEICIPKQKEVKYFDRKENLLQGPNWYLAHFINCTPESLKGEFTPSYFYDRGAAEEIKKLFPDAKLIVCLRDPVDRAFSHFTYARRKGTETAKDIRSSKRKDFTEWGLYAQYLEHYYSLFPKEHILVLIYEDIKPDPVAFMQRIFAFLGVDESFVPKRTATRENVTGNIQFRFMPLNIFISKTKRFLRKFKHGHLIIFTAKKVGLNKVATKLLSLNRKKGTVAKKEIPVFDDDTRVYLEQYYTEDVSKLEKLIDRNLDIWRTKKGQQ